MTHRRNQSTSCHQSIILASNVTNNGSNVVVADLTSFEHNATKLKLELSISIHILSALKELADRIFTLIIFIEKVTEITIDFVMN